MNKRQPSISSDPPVIEQLKREKAQSDREVSRLQRELELVKGKTGGKIQSLEEALERSSLSLGQATADLEKTSKSNAKLQEELSLLQDSVIDQQYEIASLKSRQKAIDSELARKDKDAAQLLAAVRRYKSRLDYLKEPKSLQIRRRKYRRQRFLRAELRRRVAVQQRHHQRHELNRREERFHPVPGIHDS